MSTLDCNNEKQKGGGEDKKELEKVEESEEEDTFRDRNFKAVTILLSEFYDGAPLFKRKISFASVAAAAVEGNALKFQIMRKNKYASFSNHN